MKLPIRIPPHPFPLLLYLEWILLGIAFLATLPPPFVPPRRRFAGPPPEALTLGVVLCIGILGVLGLLLPIKQAKVYRVLYTALGFGLSWAVVLFGGLSGNSFPALLLVVVIRGALLFPWKGRIVVAVLAFGSFVLRLLIGIQRFYSSGWLGPGRPLPRGLRRLSEEQIQQVLFNLSLNATLLFGLVLVFVLIMVGALLTERASRDRLAAANERLRRYALLIENQATLDERTRIAREIHDSVGHALTAQSIQLENVALQLPANVPKATDHLEKARTLGKAALQNVRQSVATLRRSPLQDKSLPEALSQLIQDFERNTGIEVISQLQLHTALPSAQATPIYRIAQEALTNIAKHSQAHHVTLRLQETGTDLILTLQDDGCGFQLTENTTGFGLQSMRERAEALGGTFIIRSAPRAGCTLQLVVPRARGAL